MEEYEGVAVGVVESIKTKSEQVSEPSATIGTPPTIQPLGAETTINSGEGGDISPARSKQ
eukprot:540037-Alexandrium_andersonii.AAC.1